MDFKHSLGTHRRKVLFFSPLVRALKFLSAMAPPSDGQEDFSWMDPTEMGLQKKG